MFYLYEEEKKAVAIMLPSTNTCRERMFLGLENLKRDFSFHWRPHEGRKWHQYGSN